MGADSKIAWCDSTFSPWWGCTKVATGCKNCYASAFSKRTGQDVWGDDKPRRFFGLKHLGEISGLNTALTVSASAIGPAAFSLGLDWSGSYQVPVVLCILGLAVLLIWALVQPSEELSRT